MDALQKWIPIRNVSIPEFNELERCFYMLSVKLSDTEEGNEDQTRSKLCSSSPSDFGGVFKLATCLPR